jgi:hypothetical protein
MKNELVIKERNRRIKILDDMLEIIWELREKDSNLGADEALEIIKAKNIGGFGKQADSLLRTGSLINISLVNI